MAEKQYEMPDLRSDWQKDQDQMAFGADLETAVELRRIERQMEALRTELAAYCRKHATARGVQAEIAHLGGDIDDRFGDIYYLALASDPDGDWRARADWQIAREDARVK